MRRILRALIAFFSVVLFTGLLCAGVWTWVMRPSSGPQPPAIALAASPARAFLASGVVVDAEGRPAEGVWVGALKREDLGDLDPHTSRTDAEGRFSLALDEPGMVGVLGAVAEPNQHKVRVDERDLRFTLAPSCAVEVRVIAQELPLDGGTHHVGWDPEVDLAEGALLEGAEVFIKVSAYDGRPDTWGAPQRSDPQGLVRFDPAPCGDVHIAARAEGYVLHTVGPIPVTGEPVVLSVSPGALMSGQVTDPQGRPIEGAQVKTDFEQLITDEEGRYAAWVMPDRSAPLSASAPYYAAQVYTNQPTEDGTGLRVDVVLYPTETVEVWCSGRPGGSCAGIGGISCSPLLMPLGRSCTGDAPMRCACPRKPAAVRGGGKVARVSPGQREVWLDFTDGSELSVQVQRGGEPVQDCGAILVRAGAHPLEDLERGLLIARNGRCDEQGRLHVTGLPSGDWRLVVFDRPEHQRVLPRVYVVEGEPTELGVIRMEDGGEVAGVVLDGLTEDPVPGVRVAAFLSDERMLRFPAAAATTDDEGRFTMHGMDPEDYDIRVLRAPLAPVSVSVRAGETSEVALWLGDDRLLEEQELGFVHGEAGELIVHGLAPAGLAAEAGLQDGDVVTRATLFGVELSHTPEDLLSQYAGPGITVEVERDGQRYEVALR